MRFSLFNIPVTVQPTFWLFILFTSMNSSTNPKWMLLIAAIFGGSLLIHELGHAFAARKFGRNPEITIEAFGGYTSYSGLDLEEGKSFAITLAGPLFTALLIGIPYYLLNTELFSSYWPKVFCHVLMRLNIYWLCINLAPLQPLDGGKLVNFLLRKYFGERGEVLSLHLGTITAILGVLYFTLHGNYIFAFLFGFYGMQNFQATAAYTRSRRSISPFTLLDQAIRLSAEEEFEKAHIIFKKLIQSKDDYIRNHAIEGLARLLERQGKEKEAYDLFLKGDLAKMQKGNQLFLKLAYTQRQFDTITKHATRCYEIFPSFEIALLNAKAFAQTGNLELAQGWLNTARQFEESHEMDWEKISADPAFSNLKESFLTSKL